MRECEEETGYKPKRLLKLGSFVTAPANSNAMVYLYLAKDVIKTETSFDTDEMIRLKIFSLREVRCMLKNGKILDAKSIIGLYRFFELKR